MAQPPKSAAPFGGSFLSNHRQELMKIWKTERETSPATILPALFHFRIHFFLTYEKCLWFYQKKTVTMNILDKLFHVLYPPIHVILAMSICYINTAQVIALCGKPMSRELQHDSVYSDPGVGWLYASCWQCCALSSWSIKWEEIIVKTIPTVFVPS